MDAPLLMTRCELTKRLDDIAVVSADGNYLGAEWLMPLAEQLWQPSNGASWGTTYQPLITFLYRIGLVGCARSETAATTYAHMDPDLAESVQNLQETAHFQMHPVFCPALDVEEPSSKGRT